MTTQVTIEQVGGFAGAGVAGSALNTRGHVAWDALSPADRAALDRLFAARRAVDANLFYRLTRTGAAGTETTDARAEDVPPALVAALKTELD